MRSDVILSLVISFAIHGGLAFSSYFAGEKAEPPPKVEEVPTIEIMTPPPPEPEELEVVEDVAEAATEVADLAPPMQTDVPSAVIDSPFVQKIQAPPPPGLNRPTGAITIPTGPPRTVASSGLKNIFNLADLDERPATTFRKDPVFPFEMRRAGLKGSVLVEFIVDTKGGVRDAFVVRSSNPAFEAPVLQAVALWKFKPGKKGGVPQNTRVRLPLEFTLNEN
jgi:protein TonB